jgi:peptide/nickel transport system permease protein
MRSLLTAIVHNKLALFAAVYLILLAVATIAYLVWHPSFETTLDIALRNKPPFYNADDGPPHVLGTDALGRDVFVQLLAGARVSLLVGIVTVVLSGTIGILLGLFAGYFRGWVDDVIMRLVDLQMSVPSLLIALLVLYVLGPGLTNVILVMAVTRWMVYARVTRGLVLSLREALYVEAAKTLGASSKRIIFRHILPNSFATLAVLGTLEIALVLLTEASLDFLGLGIQPPETSWGLQLAEGQQYLTSAWWLVTFPGCVILLTALSINLLAITIRQWLNEHGGTSLRRQSRVLDAA